MGRDKALLQLAGRDLVSRALDSLRSLPLATPPRIAGARSDLSRFAPVVADLHPGCGPISGIEAGLAASSQPLNLFLAVDLPFIPSGFLRLLLDRALLTGALVTYPRVLGRAQPLCAVYHRDLLPRVIAAIDAGNHKIADLVYAEPGDPRVDHFDMELVVAANREIHAISPLPWRNWFQNLNTPADLASGSCLPGRDA